MDRKLKEFDSTFPGLVDTGTCNLHIAHNPFGIRLQQFGIDVSNLCFDLHKLFSLTAARREDYQDIQLDLEVEMVLFHHHTEVRWLTLGPAVARLLEQWDAIVVFVETLAKAGDKTAPKSGPFKRVNNLLVNERKQTLVQLNFLNSVVPLFESSLTIFQTEEPMIHLLYDNMHILGKLLNRFIKMDVIEERKHKLYTVDISRTRCLTHRST